MDIISELPDALLLNILSLLPARDVVATMVLSKRWQLLWMMVPRLIYDDSYQNIEYERFSRFVYRSLLLHEAPVLDTLHFKLGPTSDAVDIGVWTRTALKRSVRELIIKLRFSRKDPVIFPWILYKECSVLVKLELKKVVLVDVTSPISFPSLKILSLKSVKYPGDEFVQRLLSNCPVLKSLNVKQCPDDNVTIFSVKVPSLKSLVLDKSRFRDTDIAAGIVIDAPLLQRFVIRNAFEDNFCVIENEMHNIVEVEVDVAYHPGNILSSITSVRRLSLCIPPSKDAYPVGTVFCSLVYLEICTVETEWLNDMNLLMRVLKDSPNLRALRLEQINSVPCQPRPCWSEPSSVPECVTSSLETLEWRDYEGAEEEKQVIAFILKNANYLKKAYISSESESTDPNKKLKMRKELSLFPRRSPTCQLAFD